MPSIIWKGTDPVVPEVFFLDVKKSRFVYFGAVSSPFLVPAEDVGGCGHCGWFGCFV